jgi:two-component system chemotaxis sensor kinase CheA
MSEVDDVVEEFLVESYENLDQLDRNLVALEQRPANREILSSIFRTIHTIKGTCGFLGFGKLEKVAHVGESLLSRLRDGELRLSVDITSGLLAMVDAVRQMLSSIEATGQDGDDEYPALIETLIRLQDPQNSLASSVKPAELQVATQEEAEDLELEPTPSSPQATSLPVPGPQTQDSGLRTQDSGLRTQDSPGFQSPTPNPQSFEGQESRGAVADSNIRVDVGLLDKLMNLVGELVLARNQILQFTVTQQDSAFFATSQRLNLITTELQAGEMKTRMQPIGNIWSKFPRVVRDLSLACGKQIRIEMEGKETELDKTIIEAIKDPLTHVVRNSADHGVETAEVRVARGKPAEGCLFLRA